MSAPLDEEGAERQADGEEEDVVASRGQSR